jgi:hypothetical protein
VSRLLAFRTFPQAAMAAHCAYSFAGVSMQSSSSRGRKPEHRKEKYICLAVARSLRFFSVPSHHSSISLMFQTLTPCAAAQLWRSTGNVASTADERTKLDVSIGVIHGFDGRPRPVSVDSCQGASRRSATCELGELISAIDKAT